MIMRAHVMAASVPGNRYVMDSGAEEHVSREVRLFTDIHPGSIPLQTADGMHMPTRVSGTVRGIQHAIGVENSLSLA